MSSDRIKCRPVPYGAPMRPARQGTLGPAKDLSETPSSVGLWEYQSTMRITQPRPALAALGRGRGPSPRGLTIAFAVSRPQRSSSAPQVGVPLNLRRASQAWEQTTQTCIPNVCCRVSRAGRSSRRPHSSLEGGTEQQSSRSMRRRGSRSSKVAGGALPPVAVCPRRRTPPPACSYTTTPLGSSRCCTTRSMVASGGALRCSQWCLAAAGGRQLTST